MFVSVAGFIVKRFPIIIGISLFLHCVSSLQTHVGGIVLDTCISHVWAFQALTHASLLICVRPCPARRA